MDIVIASHRGYKVREAKAFLKKIGAFDIYSFIDFHDYCPPAAPITSQEQATLAKAHHAARHLKKWILADDSVLTVPALQQTAQATPYFPGPYQSDKDNRAHLLQRMAHLEDEVARSAYFICYAALVSPQGTVYTAQGQCEGFIAFQEKGSNGFGYDPLFIKYNYQRTFAELSEETKNQISHRARALQNLTPYLELLIEQV